MNNTYLTDILAELEALESEMEDYPELRGVVARLSEIAGMYDAVLALVTPTLIDVRAQTLSDFLQPPNAAPP